MSAARKGAVLQLVVDGNEAAARVAHALSEVVAIYPITPASPMGELSEAWSARGMTNIWGGVPDVVELQSEGGAAGALHGALQSGALATTFTASQGLLLMIPNMYKIAGELTPTVIHVAARAVATHALSIFGDHSDVMATRQTGFAMLASSSVQEAQDLAAVAHAATLAARVPFLHFFDGFRTSHEINKIDGVTTDQLRSLVDQQMVDKHRERALNPNHPVLRGSAQNPDVFFQAREAINSFYDETPEIVQHQMDQFAALTGRRYHLFDYFGHPEAEHVVVVMGSGAGALREAVDHLSDTSGRRVGVLVVRLYRPFDCDGFRDALPRSVKKLCVLDRTKEPGSPGEPLFLDVTAALVGSPITVTRGRFGLGSKEFSPQMAIAVFDNLAADTPRSPITVGIVDDVTGLSIRADDASWQEPDDVVRAVFFGLGSDGTVGANKATAKIIGDSTDLNVQAYFVYDSKKSGSQTVSHLRFGPKPIMSTHLIRQATFVAIHQFSLLKRPDILDVAAPGATLLLNCPFGPEEIWDRLDAPIQQAILDKGLVVWVIDATRVANEAGLGGRVNTVLQTCFFALAKVVPHDVAIDAIKQKTRSLYSKRGDVVVRRNLDAIDAALGALHPVVVPEHASGVRGVLAALHSEPGGFVERVTAKLLAGEGDRLPVSALPVDGTFPTGTARYERRSIATEIPIWDPDICIDCGRCALVCPHAAIRFNVFEPAALNVAPDGFLSKAGGGRDFADKRVVVQVAPDDCTGCGVCVDICPAHSKENVSHKAIDMTPKDEFLERERRNFEYFLSLPQTNRADTRMDTVKGIQIVQPLFEFSGACAGCGETPYLKLMSQLVGDRVIVANATGCSSIYGGNLPTTPWTVDENGRGPAWSNSLFEDNAEFGLGIRVGVDHLEAEARRLVSELRKDLGAAAGELLDADQSDNAGIAAQRERVAALLPRLESINAPAARLLEPLVDHLVRSSVWIVGGDGWAYDIGFGGLDHVLTSGRDVNILVLDTEVYSNTGGQASKATPRGAIAKFTATGKSTAKKDLGQLAMAYGDVYVAQVAMGSNMTQVVKAFAEAEAHPGVSLIIAYSPCIAHGIDMSKMMGRQKAATESGHWPLYRYDPAREALGQPGLRLDSRRPTIPYTDFAREEARFAMLERVNPEHAGELMARAQQDIDNRWHVYEQMVKLHRTAEYVEVEE